MKKFVYKSCGIDDNEFVRGAVPMTKSEVRAVTISKLQLTEDDTFIDIGAGTGSISIEAGFLCKKVYAVEVNPHATKLIGENIDHFSLHNVEIIEGKAPVCMQDIDMVDKVFVGGTKGNMIEIMDWMDDRLSKNGVIVGNFITLENAVLFINELRQGRYNDIDIAQIAVSKGKFIGGLTMMEANNPIYIVSGVKQ